MKHISLKVLCLLLAVALLLGLFPTALAAELPESSGQPTETMPEESTAPFEETTESESTEPAQEMTPQETAPSTEEDIAIEEIPIDEEAPISPQASVTGNLTRSDYINGKYYFWGDAVRTYQFTYADGTAVTAKVGGMCIHYVDGVVAYCIEPGTGSSHNVT